MLIWTSEDLSFNLLPATNLVDKVTLVKSHSPVRASVSRALNQGAGPDEMLSKAFEF